MKLKGIISAAAAAALIVGAMPSPMGTMAEKAAVSGDTIYNTNRVSAPAVTTTAKKAVTATTAKAAVTTTTAKATTTAKTTTTTVRTTTAAPTTTTTTTTYKPAVQGQPVFHITNTEVCQTEARNKKQQVSIIVNGANGLYCDTLIYVYYDSRMTAETAVAVAIIINVFRFIKVITAAHIVWHIAFRHIDEGVFEIAPQLIAFLNNLPKDFQLSFGLMNNPFPSQ